MAGLFYVTDHYGNEHLMSDRGLRNKIVKQSEESNYNWLAPANELLKTCNNPKFDKECAKDIKVAIVNCYADFLKGDVPSNIIYAYDAYNELFDIQDDEKVLTTRKKFLRAYVTRNILWNKYLTNIHKTYLEAREKWIEDTVDELLKIRHVKFAILKDDLLIDFEKYIDKGINDGIIIEKLMNFNFGKVAPELSERYKETTYSDEEKIKERKLDDETLIRIKNEVSNEGVASSKPSKPQNSFIKKLKKIIKR